MPVLRKLVGALAAVIILAPPLMACAVPVVQMSAPGKACCHPMAGQCGSTDMQDSHSCCKETASAPAGVFQIKQRDASFAEISAHVSAAHALLAPALSMAASAKQVPVFSESPPGHTSVLRI